MKTPKGKKVTREVEIDLDDSTHAKLSKERGDKLRTKARLTAEFEEVKTKWTERIKPISDRLAVLDESVRNGKEKKTVECVLVKNFEDNKMEYWFEGKIVDHRPMTAADRQEDLVLKNKKKRTNSVVMPEKEDDVTNVRKLETSKRTKHSSVDGPKTNGLESPTPA